VTTDVFGARLRHERERRGIALSSVADRTKIAPQVLVALERGDFTRLPGGLYRRAFLRAYSEALGLDPDETLREFIECFPDAAQTQPGNGADVQPAAPAAPGSPGAMVRVRIDSAPQVCRAGPVFSDARHRLAAVAADLGMLGLISMGFWVALADFWMPLAIAMAVYYAGGILVLGNTPGVCLSAAIAAEDPAQAEASHASHA
jgi:transcriptional regulator with XRE-family HTH domain